MRKELYKSDFWLIDRFISIVKEEKTFFQLSSYLATCITQHWSGRSQDYQEPEILNKTGLFLSL